MKILCSGELYPSTYPITTDSCIYCSVEHRNQPPCGYSSYLLRSIFMGIEDRRKELHASDLSGCLLARYYSKVDPCPVKVHEYFKLWIGIALHYYIAQANDPEVVEQGHNAMGLDFRVDVLDNGDLFDFKTTRWIKDVTNLPRKEDVAQMNVYKNLLNEEGYALEKMFLQYIDVTGPPTCRSCGVMMQMQEGVVQCPICHYVDKRQHLGVAIVEAPVYDRDTYLEKINLRRDALLSCLENKIPPEPEPDYYCGFCSCSCCSHYRPR